MGKLVSAVLIREAEAGRIGNGHLDSLEINSVQKRQHGAIHSQQMAKCSSSEKHLLLRILQTLP